MSSPTLPARLAHLQTRYALPLTALLLCLTALLVPVARGLGLRSGWVELLPHNAPSVRDLRAGEQRVGGLSTLTVMLSGGDRAALIRYAEALVPRLHALPPSLRVREVRANVGDYQAFVRTHRHLYAPLAELREVHDAVRQRIDYERARMMPGYISLDDPPEPLEALVDRVAARARAAEARAERLPGGYFVHPDGRHLAVFLRVDVKGGDAPRARAVVARVREEIAAVDASGAATGVQAELAGDLFVGLVEHDAIERELVVATLLTIALCVLVLLVLFRRPRALVLLGVALGVPVVATFALARLTVGHLNTSTAFLGSIVIGNGINPGIVWLARYFEERRAGHAVPEAIAATHRGAWGGTLTASLAASLAYGSLVVTDFRGFRDFGIIGGLGMVLCWALTLALLPALCALWERWRPLPARVAAQHNPYGALFARVAHGHASRLLAVCGLLAVAATALTVVAVLRDPLDYNFRNLSSIRRETARASVLNRIAGETVGRAGAGAAIAVLVERREDVAAVQAALLARAAQPGAPIGPTRSMDDLLPRDQEAKLPLLAGLRRMMLEARAHASPALQQTLDAHLPPETLRPLVDADLPVSVASLYTERDGTRGRLLFVEERPGAPIWDGRYLVAWSGAVRSVRAADGSAPRVVGNAPVYADLISAIWRDGPRAVGVSFVATLALVALSFRRGRDRALTLGALLLGVVWMTGTMAALRLRLNFLNFVALPITFGIGVDYAVNVMRRFVQEVDDGVDDPVTPAVAETGGAVVACSLTTIFGYSALLTSANRALNSFGLAAVIGEVACLLATVVALSAALVWVTRRLRATAGGGG